MEIGTALKILRDVVNEMEVEGILKADGTFDQTKLDTIQEDVAFAAGVEKILEEHGLNIPAKVDKIIQIIPLIWGIIQ